MTMEPMTTGSVTAHELFRTLLKGRWGLKIPLGTSKDVNTIQEVSYTLTTNALDYGKTWVVRDAILGATEPDGKIRPRSPFKASLFFSAGPNAGTTGLPSSARKRTSCAIATTDYEFFKKGVRASIDFNFERHDLRRNWSCYARQNEPWTICGKIQ